MQTFIFSLQMFNFLFQKPNSPSTMNTKPTIVIQSNNETKPIPHDACLNNIKKLVQSQSWDVRCFCF